MKRLAVAILLLALPGMAACGDDEDAPAPAPPSSATITRSTMSWPPPLPANALEAQRVQYAALLAEAADRGLSVARAEVDALWTEQEAKTKAQGAELDGVLREEGVTREGLAHEGWRILILDKIREQEGMTTTDDTVANAQRGILEPRIIGSGPSRATESK